MIPYYFRHYGPIGTRFYIYDDNSNDKSLEMLSGDPRVSIKRFTKSSDSYIASSLQLYNKFWKQSRGKADWVIICSMDEHIYHPNLCNFLLKCKNDGITILKAEGYQMISDKFPLTNKRLCDIITRGISWSQMNKTAIFNPNEIEEINYTIGRHSAEPSGNVKYPEKENIKLLHFKYLGLDYLIERSAELRTGLKEIDIEKGWGHRYLWKKEKIREDFIKINEASTEIKLLQ